MDIPTVRLKNKSLISNTAEITINGQTIPITKATVYIELDEPVVIEAEILAGEIDVVALEGQTQVTVVEKRA